MIEIPLTGGKTNVGIVKVGDTVRRPINGNSKFVQELLCYLEKVGFNESPRFLGIDEQGREIFSYIKGYVPSNLGMWSDAQLVAAAKFIKRFHDVSVGSEFAGKAEVVCHNDLSPCNFVFIDNIPAAIIDFDAAAPGTRVCDLAYAAWLWLDIGNDEIIPDEQKRRLLLFAEAYGFADIQLIIDTMMLRQREMFEEALRRQKNCMANWANSGLEWVRRYLK